MSEFGHEIPFEHTYPRVGVATILFKDRINVLIGRGCFGTDAGKWGIPGGAINPFETIQEASARVTLEKTGATIQAKQMLFLSEKVAPPDDHRIVLYCEGVYVSGELNPGDDLSEVRWVDPRELGLYQHEMSEMTISAFYKYSLVLRARAASGQE